MGLFNHSLTSSALNTDLHRYTRDAVDSDLSVMTSVLISCFFKSILIIITVRKFYILSANQWQVAIWRDACAQAWEYYTFYLSKFEKYLIWHKNRFVWVQAQVSRDFEQNILFFSPTRAYPTQPDQREPSQTRWVGPNWQRALCWVVCMSIIHFLEEYRQ